MRKLPIHIITVMLCGTASGYSQATFAFRNYNASYGINAPVFDSSGIPLYGTDYVAALYGGLTPDSLVEAYSAVFGGLLRVPFTYTPSGESGYFSSGYDAAELPNVPVAGILIWLQVRVWDVRLASSYEEVAAMGVGGYGASQLFQDYPGGVSAGPPIPPGPLYHLESFSLVPEPGLALLFPAGLLLFVCAKRWKVRR